MTGGTQGSSNNSQGTDTDTSGSTTTSDDDEDDDPSSDPTVPVDNPVVTAPPAYQADDNRRSGLQDSDTTATTSRVDNSPAATLGASSTTPPGGDVTGLSTTNTTVSVDNTETATLVLDLPQGPDPQESHDPVAVLTAIELDSELLAGGGLSTDGPIAPPLPGVILGSLDLVRRDLEQMSAPLNDDTTPGTTDPLIIDPPNNDSEPVLLAAESTPAPPPPSWSVSDPLTVNPTPAERVSAFQIDQAKRIRAFNDAQADRVDAFNDQLDKRADADPLGALVASAGFVVSELVNTAAAVVTEFVNYISLAVTNLIQGLSDWFTTPATFKGVYGDPETNKQYFQPQHYEGSCALISMATIVGQFYGLEDMPTEEEIVQRARETLSPDDQNRMIWTDDRQAGISPKEAQAVLKTYNINSTLSDFDKTQGNVALRAVVSALQEKNAVSVGVNNHIVWEAFAGRSLPTGTLQVNHQVVIIGIDFDARVVIINDSGFGEEMVNGQLVNGQNMRIPLDGFMQAWQIDNYDVLVAKRPQPNTSASSGPASTNISNSGVLVDVA